MKHIWTQLGKETYHFERSSYILFEGFKSNLVEVFNSFQIWSKSIEILCLLLQNIIINNETYLRTQPGKRNISFERSSYILFEGFENNLVEVFNKFSNLIQVYWNSVHLLLQNIIINWNKIENSTGKETCWGLHIIWKAEHHSQLHIIWRSSYILFEGFESSFFNGFQIWSKSIEILCTYYCRIL